MTRLEQELEKQRAISEAKRGFMDEISKLLLAEQAVRDKLEHGGEDADEE
jgi:hypothetical protein